MSVNSLARARAIQSAEPAIPSRWRSLEMVVGLISFGLVTLPVWASLISPAATALFVCFFSLYWLHSSVRFALNALLGIRRLGQACRRDWAAEAVRQPGFERLWHLVLIPTYREPEAVLTATLDHLVAQDFPRERLIVVLAFEARDAGAPDRWRALEAAYQGRFGRLWATFHPDIPGEVKGKASNETWAARWATDRLEREVGCALDDVVLTTCDADSHFHPSYFSALTRLYLNNPDRRFTIYQSAMLFYSNLWRLPLPQAALTALQSLWQLSRMVPAHRLINQSTYSLSLRSCREVGYWDRTVIPEDSHMFFQMYFHFGSRVRVDPIFLPLLADGAEGRNWLGSCRALYEQEKRWAWGVADIPFVLVGIRNGRGSRWWSRLFRCWPFVEEHLLWPANWFLLALGTRLPERLARANDRPLVDLAIDVAHVALTLSTLPLAVCAVAHYALVAGAPGQTHTRRVLTLAGWLLLPIESFVFVSLPAIEAHLRLLLGRRLEYRVTEKIAPEVGA
ncbi:MAG TPA: glycosyltransferase, partial [Dehalococcoidia bacterium]|nr:glycosyltransferase [Dehalococcoidia bacterium]